MARFSWQDPQYNPRGAQTHDNDVSCWLVRLGLGSLNDQKPMFVVPLHFAYPMPVRLSRRVEIFDVFGSESQIGHRHHET